MFMNMSGSGGIYVIAYVDRGERIYIYIYIDIYTYIYIYIYI